MAFFVLTMVNGPRYDRSRARREQDGWEEHAAFMDGLLKTGFVVLGGPIGDGEQVMVVAEADGEAEVRARLADDPWGPLGILEIGEIRPWTIWLDGRAAVAGRAGPEGGRIVLQEWENFAVITGSAAGALTGLLFVAVSLNRDRIVGHAGLRAEAGQTLVLFIVALLLAVLLVIPGMSASTLGVVLVVVSVVVGGILILIDRHKQRPDRGAARGRPRPPAGERAKFSNLNAEDQLYRLLDAISPNMFSALCVTIAGCVLLAGGNGLYWLAAAVLLALGGGVVNAWLFLTGAPAIDAGEKKDDGVTEDAG